NQFDNWIPTPPRLNPFPETPSGLPALDMEQPREFSDWRQLFSFTDPDQPVPMAMEGLTELEDEWRQIYWQETPMADLLQDGGWVHG
ncbi:regulatory protein, partial [Aspergillus sclerotialis]